MATDDAATTTSTTEPVGEEEKQSTSEADSDARDSVDNSAAADNTHPPADDTKEDSQEDTHRVRIYRAQDPSHPRQQRRRRGSESIRKFSVELSKQIKRSSSNVIESLPDTPMGWTVLASTLMSAGLGYELSLQKKLTQPPCTFAQLPEGSVMESVFQKMTATPESILSRDIQPSLFVGTRGNMSSTAAYFLGGPPSAEQYLRLRDIVQSPIDGATFAVDWEVPWKVEGSRTAGLSKEQRTEEILKGPIQEPVVIILHGINNDASFGYIKSLQRTFARRGWNAAAMNFRGVGGVPMTTPRSYNGAYTGDLRSLVWTISGRLADDVPVFLVGNSLGAGIMSNYLGQESYAGSLPTCVSGGVSLGNPLVISRVAFPFDILIALGVKRILLENWAVMKKMIDPTFQKAVRTALFSTSVRKMDNSFAPILVRNDDVYPFGFQIGFDDATDYFERASSYQNIRHISVPFLNLSAEDDLIVAGNHKGRLGFCVSNPNVMVSETRCGGHLGWQESSPETASHFGASSWAEVAAADFFDSVMKTNVERYGTLVGRHVSPGGDTSELLNDPTTINARQAVKLDAAKGTSTIKARL
eukprot:Nitzschia sp. Nitz4//scaffold9_size221794//52458//54215//NITZ4_001331-RA/size221794-processed-gene-0.9-mRNA-1//1//CDS//3329560956//660//frame0